MSTKSPVTAEPVKLEIVNPEFQGVAAVAVPVEFAHTFTPQAWGVLTQSKNLTIRQHVKFLPKSCCSCPPCPKQENTYSVYAGVGSNAEHEFLRIDEVSDDWNRCCCAPYHPLRMEVRQYVPMPGDKGASDFKHLTQDIVKDWNRWSPRDKAAAMRNYYMSTAPILSMVRDDGMRCCYKCPCKCLNTYVCFDCCRDGVHVYTGAVADEPGKEKGRPWNLDPNKLVGSAIQPNYGGICTPTLHLRGPGQDHAEPWAKIEGPCFFGGWSEMCCNFKFYTSYWNSPTKAGDVAEIIKKRPASLTAAFVELTTDSDVYGIEFKDEKITAEQKVTILAAQLLADYMFFDGNTEKCENRDDAIYCYCCYYSCFGHICPVYCCIPKGNN